MDSDHEIVVTDGLGAKSGINKRTVAISGVEARGRARHFTDYGNAQVYIDELKQEYPGASVVYRTR